MRNIKIVSDRQTVMLMLISVLLSVNAADMKPAPQIDKIGVLNCTENGDCPTSKESVPCHKICGCDRSAFVAIYYNETSKSCVVSFKHLMISQLKIYGDDSNESGSIEKDTMAEKIRIEAERIFNTILVSVILFLTCCIICVITACLYCCRISYTDYRLKKDIKALARKLKRDNIKFGKSTKKPLEPINESCNVVCEDAGVFVV